MILTLTLTAAVAIGWLSRAGAHAAIRHGFRVPREGHVDTPATLGLRAREIRIATRNGKRLFGWFIAATRVAPMPAVVVMHGWGANASLMLSVARPLHDAGYAVLLLDARGHGRSDDDGFASLPRFAEDIEHGLDWLRRQPEVDAARCAVLGHSVGAGAALLAASRRPDVAAVVSVSAFAHPEVVMRRILAQWRVPYLLVGWYVLRHVQRIIGYRFNDIAPVNTIAGVRCPVLLAHGTEDQTVPFADARRILAARAHSGVRLIALSGGHDTHAAMMQRIGALINFLDTALGGIGVAKTSDSSGILDSGIGDGSARCSVHCAADERGREHRTTFCSSSPLPRTPACRCRHPRRAAKEGRVTRQLG